MSIDLEVFWAKFVEKTSEHMSLLQHSRDITSVINEVSKKLLAPASEEFLQSIIGETPLHEILTLAAISHDVGKASPYFQQKVPSLSQRVTHQGYGSDVTSKEIYANPHSIISAHTLISWFEQHRGFKLSPADREFWFHVIAGHHGAYSEFSLPSDALLREIRIWPEWQEARFVLLDKLTGEHGLEEESLRGLASIFGGRVENNMLSTSAAALITGLLISADWVASSTDNFPLTNSEPQDQDYRTKDALTRINLGNHWQPGEVTTESFLDRFSLPASATMRNVQEAVVKLGHQLDQPALVILENETGSGKTEAALALAEIMAEKFGFNGLFFAQPTRVTSNAIFARVAEWLIHSVPDDTISTVLAHGKAEFNDEFKAITTGDLTAIYDNDSSNGDSPLEATQWFQGRKTGLLASVAVGTIDQILFAVLQSKHNVLRHLGLAGKVVIIDEIHAADAYMRVYTTRLLEWLGLYGVPVIALSATLPPKTRKQLIDAYQQGASRYSGRKARIDKTPVYPRITWVDGQKSGTIAPEHDGLTRTTHYSFMEGDLEEMANEALELSKEGGCIGIICSTVSRAQELYELIASREEEVVLLHSRFLTSDRAILESALVKKLGRKAGTSRPKKLIVVSTQIIEQGLDLDFDAMITDIAPTDLIIQRIGRVHRHQMLNDARPDALKIPQLKIFGAGLPDTESSVPEIQTGSKRVYRHAPLLRSVRVLTDHATGVEGTITTPDDVESLVTSSYDINKSAPETWKATWTAAHVEEKNFETDQESRAATARIPDPLAGNLAGWTKSPSLADEQAAVAQVRDADESFEVVVVQNRLGRLFALPHIKELEGQSVDGVMELDYRTARTLATCTVRLPEWSLTDDDLFDLEADGQESWQKSRWLKGSLPLVLDENLERELERYILKYDEQLGLLLERKEQ